MYEIFNPYPEIAAGTTTKTDGNMSFLTGDPNPLQTLHLRKKYFAQRKLDPSRLICLNQTHGSNIAILEENDAGKGALTHATAISSTDASITNVDNLILGVLTADCLPILLYDPRTRAIGAIHAGWRGLIAGILPNTIQKMSDNYQTNPKDVIVGIGPSIGPCCYEIQDDVALQIRKTFGDQADQLLKSTNSRMTLDLRQAAFRQLRECGLTPTNIQVCDLCTKDNPDLWYSYRYRPNTGLMLSYITYRRING
jgi:polyphenol oxidase